MRGGLENNKKFLSKFASVLILIFAFLSNTNCKDSSRGATSEKPPVRYQLNMYVQDKGKAQGRNNFFADGRVMRLPVPDTVSIESPEDIESPLYNNGVSPTYLKDAAGKETKTDSPRNNPNYVQNNPFPMSMDLLKRGQERYNIYCAPCHGTTGYGNGAVPVKAKAGGFNWNVASLHSEELRKVADGHFFYVMTHGYSTMPAYEKQIPLQDRWAIVAYIRALQKSQNASLEDVSVEKRSELK